MATDSGTIAAARTRGRDRWTEHWNDFAGSAARNPAQAYRRKLVFGLLDLTGAPPPVRLLDLGSGTGDLALQVSRTRPDAEILGLDLSASGVAMASRKVPRGRFIQQDFTRPLEGAAAAPCAAHRGWATHAVCSEVLEHVDDPIEVLRNASYLMAPGCRLAVTVPGGPMSAFDRHIGHRAHFGTARFEAVLRSAGYEVEDLRSAGFPFFNLYRLAVIARGEKLVDDAAGQGRGLPLAARATMRAFSWLFRFNASKTGPGWQLAARARFRG
ncbi:MAG: class I SAM-dependent methyltransferase [Polyangiaceae bacterium]